jgi:hypothetical protein
MKAKFLWVIISVFVVGFATKPQAAPPEQAKSAKVYYDGTGSERDVKRFEKFLETALGGYGLVRADSAANADVVVKAQFEEKEEIALLYSPVLWTTFTSNQGKDYTVKSCDSISDSESIFKDPVKSMNELKLPAPWEKASPKSAIYIGKPALKDSGELIRVLREALAKQHYRVVNIRAEADGELKSISVQKFIAPVHVMAHSLVYEVVDKDSKKFLYGNSGSRTYLGLDKSINVGNMPCGSLFEMFGKWSGGKDPYDDDAKDIAKTIHEHISK